MYKEIIKPALILFIVCVIVTGSLAYVNGITGPIIDENNKITEQLSLAQVLPDAESFSDAKDAQQLKTEGFDVNERILKLFEGKKGQETIGYIVQVSSKGYGGAIKMFVGVDTNKNITGVLLTEQNETPGLGSKASEPKFIAQYLKTIPEKEFFVVKGSTKSDNDIQAISGATISSRAVTQSVNDAIALINSMAGGV